ncbi:MAG: hypothetical protein Q7K38_02445, partial [Candidatus Wildermuthbacteria bacterium]|nr:hypothetical protein [Candidatus Wildermuthbacteria bacterium]
LPHTNCFVNVRFSRDSSLAGTYKLLHAPAKKEPAPRLAKGWVECSFTYFLTRTTTLLSARAGKKEVKEVSCIHSCTSKVIRDKEPCQVFGKWSGGAEKHTPPNLVPTALGKNADNRRNHEDSILPRR